MSFKTTIQNQRISHFVASSALGLAAKVTTNVEAKLQPMLEEGEILPDLKLLQKLVARFLEKSGLGLLEADDRYSNDQLVGRDLRIERKELVQQLRSRLRDVQYLFRRQFGDEKTAAFLPQQAFSRLRPAELIRLASQVLPVLRDPERGWQKITAGGFDGSSAGLAEMLENEARQLQEAIDRQEGEQARQRQLGLEEKAAGLESAKKAIRGGAQLLAGLYTFADLPFHAERVRRRVSRKTAMPETETMGDNSPNVPPGGSPPVPHLTEEVIHRLPS